MNYAIGDRLKDLKQLDKKYLTPRDKDGKKVGDYAYEENSDIAVVTNVTSNSVELYQLARTDMGVSGYQWYSVAEGPALKEFEKRFKKI